MIATWGFFEILLELRVASWTVMVLLLSEG
jgi:hypothetical protein